MKAVRKDLSNPADRIRELGAENERLREIVRALSHEKALHAVRFEITFGSKGKTPSWTMIITDPQGDEERMAHMIAQQFKVFECVAQARLDDGKATLAADARDAVLPGVDGPVTP